MGQWLDSITGWLTLNPQWLAAAVLIVACVECLAIAGLIVPGTVLLFGHCGAGRQRGAVAE